MAKGHRKLKRGFSLTELLIVMSILTLVLLILVPSFGRVVSISRRVHCANNLRHIGEAYGSLKADEKFEDLRPLQALGWARKLIPYLGEDPQALRCLEDDEGAYSPPDVKIRIYDGSTWLYDVDTFTSYPFWLEGSHRDAGFAPGVWMVNNDIYPSLVRTDMPRYTPGMTPKEYWFVIEDQRSGPGATVSAGDRDFYDFDVHVSARRDRQYELTGYKRAASYSFALVGPEGDVTDKTNGAPIGPFLYRGIGDLSYGMSWYVSRMLPGQQKILVVDYEQEVCYVGPSCPYVDEGYDVLVAPRHLGKLNVLYCGGSVTLKDPDEIDPDVAENDDFYWEPLN